jgi:hypothetical protein
MVADGDQAIPPDAERQFAARMGTTTVEIPTNHVAMVSHPFLIRGHMAISASGQGGVLVHVDSGRSAGLVATTKATTAVMQGQEMPGWLRVSPEDLASDDDLSRWVDIGIEYARSLPPKQPAKTLLKK